MDSRTTAGRVLIVDDDALVLQAYERVLSRAGFQVQAVEDAASAVRALDAAPFDAVVTDVRMPGMDGIQLLKTLRERNPELPVLVMTGEPRLDSAVAAIDHGAVQYLIKPVDAAKLESSIVEAIRRRRARYAGSAGGAATAQRAADERGLAEALEQLWIAYQPIIRWPTRELFGHEALVRSHHAEIKTPDRLLTIAERVGRLPDLGRRIRRLIDADLALLPPELTMFVNLHPTDLADGDLTDPTAPLSSRAGRCVLEITERARLDDIEDARARIANLRLLGFRIAVDDLGAGHSGLTSISQLEPEIVKLDMSLIRNVHREPIKLRLVSSLIGSCRDLGLEVVAEGVETAEERDAIAGLGCELMQGYLFARPGLPFPVPTF